jgi:hypothetical protein
VEIGDKAGIAVGKTKQQILIKIIRKMYVHEKSFFDLFSKKGIFLVLVPDFVTHTKNFRGPELMLSSHLLAALTCK